MEARFHFFCLLVLYPGEALEHANEEQKKVLHEKYEKKDPASVAKVKELYNTLNLQVCDKWVNLKTMGFIFFNVSVWLNVRCI